MTTDALLARVEAARDARRQLRRRPLRSVAAALSAAARRWQDDRALRAALPETTRLAPQMIDAVVPIAAAALDEAAMLALLDRELGPGAAGRPPPDGPALVAHVLASNVPALALPAIALGCLAGAAVVVKSGRDDARSAPAFHDALAAVDPELAATVVATYWPGGEAAHEDAVLAAADVVVVSGGETAVTALRARTRGRFLAHGPRWSVVVVDELDDAQADRVALDVALHDQRGCLSPHAVYVVADAAGAARRLAAALERVGDRLPPGPAGIDERASARIARGAAEWEPATEVYETRAGTVILAAEPAFRPTCGRRTIRVHPLAAVGSLAAHLPRGAIECVGLAGAADAPLVEMLRAAGVARICRPGHMQRPPLAWPRGQLAPLGSLRGDAGAPRLEVEP